MKKFFKMFGAVGLLAGMMMAAGCGDDATPAVNTRSGQHLTNATVVGGTVTVGTTSTASTLLPPPAGAVALTIPGGSKFTNGTGPAITTVPTVSVSTPTSGVSGMTQPKTGSATGFTVQSAAGAVDITFDGLTSVTFVAPFVAPGVTVTIPVSPALPVNSTVDILVVKDNGFSYTKKGTVSTDGRSVSVPNVTNFCAFYAAPVLTKTSGGGGTGSTGGTGTIGSLGLK